MLLLFIFQIFQIQNVGAASISARYYNCGLTPSGGYRIRSYTEDILANLQEFYTAKQLRYEKSYCIIKL